VQQNRSPRSRKVSLADLAVLIGAVGQCSRDPELSDLDADRTLTSLLRDLSPFVWVSEESLESALAYANMLDEKKGFVDFRGNTFDQLAARIGRFNKQYNWFESEDK
jgi:hypothetical protein